jgi:hypothetical protein
VAWTTSNEFYYGLALALKKIRNERRDLPPDIAIEIRRLIKSIDRICQWRGTFDRRGYSPNKIV